MARRRSAACSSDPRRGWAGCRGDIDWEQRSIHICRNAVKVTGEEIFVKEPKTRAGNRYVYFSAEMESLLWEYRQECAYITETYDQRELTTDDFLFRRQGAQLPMTPTTFTYRFKLILKKNGLPQELNVHSLRHTAASLMIAGGTDVATVAGILGHSQPSTTLDIYTHASTRTKRPPARDCKGCWRYRSHQQKDRLDSHTRIEPVLLWSLQAAIFNSLCLKHLGQYPGQYTAVPFPAPVAAGAGGRSLHPVLQNHCRIRL